MGQDPYSMKRLFLGLLLGAGVVTATAQVAGDEDRDMYNKGQERDQQAVQEAVTGWWKQSMKTHEERIAWWRQAKFGMFIHWGVYSLPGGEWKGQKVGGYAEHLMRVKKIPRSEYLELAHGFNPVLFNADEWARAARDAGMRYMIITAKHHDGFAMYPSSVSDFNIHDQTPFKRDPLAELSAACKKYGIKFGFYYSHAFDWEHPDAPGNDWEYKNPGGDKNLFGGRDWFDHHPELLPKAVQYVNEKAIPQIKELLTRYHPDILWFDTPHKLPFSENLRILKTIRETDPDVVVNGRLARNTERNYGDYLNTADRPAEFPPATGDWEAIPTTNESYGYSRYDNSHKSVPFFIQLLAKAAARGGNLLMNIGPKGDGTIDTKDLAILKGIGNWVKQNSESIYNVAESPLPLQNWGVSTLRGNKIYLHIFDFPADRKLYVGGLQSAISKAYTLSGKKIVKTKRIGRDDLQIDLSGVTADVANTVIVLELKDQPGTDRVFFVAPNIPVTRLLAFDAQLEGKGFGFGDGKAGRYYVEGWKSAAQQLVWNIRTMEARQYDVVIKYVTGKECDGNYKLLLNNTASIEGKVQQAKGGVVTEKIGKLELKRGVNTLVLSPEAISGTELMKLLEVQLVLPGQHR
ncbi:Alpha-L-fucosidase [Niabella drilacis]|uniref:alpha-L-fucosidase n=2 Tax=Niabella drilacis (strain DSM 25811 / CCM 8410 / CCUG 62505 / LMG 26954 / E90) TaxID=1285928 RepID=A0A1G6I8W6_NIADE|nr:Alpha-L-fucosidase [Niabella drilacis]